MILYPSAKKEGGVCTVRGKEEEEIVRNRWYACMPYRDYGSEVGGRHMMVREGLYNVLYKRSYGDRG
jgi:hypothetical protein